MDKVKKISGGILAIVGYLLSPLSWWNDLFINIPLAYLFACLVRFFLPNYFLPSMILGYWLTNVAGFIIMHTGIRMVAADKNEKREILKDLLISVFYTLLVLILYYFGWLKFPTDYHF